MIKWLVIIIGLALLVNYFSSYSRPSTPSAAATAPTRPSVPPTSAADVAAAVFVQPWRLQESRSAIDDSKSIYLTAVGQGLVRGRFVSSGTAELQLRCVENTTAVTLRLADNFMASVGSYGTVVYRVDDRDAQSRQFQESASNEVLGLWRGAAAIPFIKSLLGGKTLVMRATPFNENPIEATFDIEGLEEALTPLRRACSW